MEPLERQSEPDVQPTCFDPDAVDVSEQQFAASLEAEAQKLKFVVNAPDVGASTAGASGLVETPADRRDAHSSKINSDEGESKAEQSNVGPVTETVADWRNEVAAKVGQYKSRRSPKVRYPSLQLQFETVVPRRQEASSMEPTVHLETAVQSAPVGQVVPRHPAPPAFVTLESTARVIEFPRVAVPARTHDELAEPMLERPRIVEAPSLLPPPPALGGILLEEENDQPEERQPGFDMPLQSARLSRRMSAAGIDASLVATGLAIFGYTFLKLNGSMPELRSAFEATAMLAAILWFSYQYAFLVFTGATPGLKLTNLAVTHFDGAPVSRRMRRWRVLASLLSCISLGLGYAWCFLDEDQLSWHDRITKTHLAPMNSPLIPGPGVLNS
jgi:uncharacterized RDD family membrane protein YckC